MNHNSGSIFSTVFLIVVLAVVAGVAVTQLIHVSQENADNRALIDAQAGEITRLNTEYNALYIEYQAQKDKIDAMEAGDQALRAENQACQVERNTLAQWFDPLKEENKLLAGQLQTAQAQIRELTGANSRLAGENEQVKQEFVNYMVAQSAVCGQETVQAGAGQSAGIPPTTLDAQPEPQPVYPPLTWMLLPASVLAFAGVKAWKKPKR